MSDLKAAGNAAEAILNLVKKADELAQPGTAEHAQILGAILKTQFSRIVFCLEVLTKQR